MLVVPLLWAQNGRSSSFISTRYVEFDASHVDGTIMLKWKTSFERNCTSHIIERRELGSSGFEIVAEHDASGNVLYPIFYTYFDNSMVEGKTYEYRIGTNCEKGRKIYSSIVRVRTGQSPGIISIDHFREGLVLNIRFSAEASRDVRLQLLDEKFRQLSILYQGKIGSGQQILLQYKDPLPVGKYYLIAETDEARIYEDLIIGE